MSPARTAQPRPQRAGGTTTYTKTWRDTVREGAVRSAETLVPILVEGFRPTSVIDVGCGEGWFIKEFEKADCKVTGVDGPWVDDILQVDFSHPPYPMLGRFDLALTLEVAEHIPAEYADDFVDWLVQLAPTVVFSAAIPGQGGNGHTNEQWPQYWAEKFAARGYLGTGALRAQIWDDTRIEPWYRQNLLVFVANLDHGLRLDGCPALVHPEIWSIYR